MTGTRGGESTIRDRLEEVRRRIEAAARRAGRQPSEITLIGVTKTIPADRIGQAVEAGLTDLGENRVQEAEAKIAALGGAQAGLTWHLIGHLQSNKARKAASLFPWIHSVDSADLIARLGRTAPDSAEPINILLQVDLGHEETKHGVDAALLADLARAAAETASLRPCGLMTIPPLFDDPERSRPFFGRMRRLRDDLAARGLDLPHLSMGMTNDFEVAVEEGATMVRVGRAIFGERPDPGARMG